MTTWLVVSSVLLWLAVLVLGVLVFALTRQIGVLYERVAPAGALMMNQRLQAGDPAPPVEAPLLGGGQLRVGEGGQRTLLFFLAPDCPICKSLLPVLGSVGAAESDVRVVLASDGDDEQAHRDYVAENDLTAYPYLLSETLGRTYGVSKLPYAVLITESGTIASLGIVNSREHLESLFVAHEVGVASLQDFLAGGGEPPRGGASA